MKKLNFLFILIFSFSLNSGFSQLSFTPDVNTACLPNATVNFTNNSSTGVNFYWYMGDGGFYQTNGTAAGVNHTYTYPGNYYVYFDVYDQNWNYLGTYSDNITVEGMINPLDVTANTVCPGDLVFFNIGYSGNASNINWDFGDGVFSSNSDWYSTEHGFSAPGSYTVTVTADYPTCGNLQATTIINVGTNNPLVTNQPLQFYPYDDTICPGDRAEFYVPYNYNSYYVNFGDGSNAVTNNDHIYNTTGDYSVTLTLVNGCGNSLTLVDTMHVRNNLPVDIYPNTELTYGAFCINTPVELYYPYGDIYSSYLWDFGNGNTTTGSVVTHSYPAAGNYLVSLTVTNGCGNSGVIVDTVVIDNNIPVVGLEIQGLENSVSDSICPNDGFFLSANVNGGAEQHDILWDFGDGNTSNVFNVTHSYPNPGMYIVTLTATNLCGNSASVIDTLVVGTNVIPDPNNYFIGMLGNGKACPGDSVVFLFSPGSPTATIEWDFNDGNTGIADRTLVVFGATYNYVKHKYVNTGSYTPEVTFTNSCGNSFTKQFTLDILNGLPPQDAGFFEDPLVYNCQGQPMDFIAFGGSNYTWDFGDGTGTLVTNSSIEAVQHIYDNPGTYEVTVEITNGCGFTVTEQNDVIVPASSFDITTNTISSNCNQSNGVAVAIVDGGKAPFTYQWSNGDNTFLADSIPAGIYVVNIIDKNGCENFAIATVSDQEAPTILTAAILDATCYGSDNGAIDISVIGSSSPYSYLWSNGRTTEDVNQLEAGPHEIVVTDAYGCVASKSIYVNEPDKVLLTMLSENADCGLSNGSAGVAVSGSTGPYNYVWSNGMSTNIITGIAAGIYNLVVVDANGCLYEESIAVSEGNLNIVVDSITGTGCTGDLANIYINVLPVSGNYTYSWSNTTTSQDNLNLATGVYTLEVTDQNNGCIGYGEYEIQDIPTVANDICIVTVDSVSNTNRVVWEKDLNATNIAYYNIYKESSQAGIYYNVGSVPYDSLSVYVDPVSNPQVRSWRYKISVVDDCGNESELSEEHKTIHLTVNQGINSTYNLIWDHYDGLNYSTYEIYRRTNSSGWQLIASLPSNLNSYTDATPPVGTEYYRVEALTVANCDATRAGVNTSRSNVKNTPSAPQYGLGVEENTLENVLLYPNPTTGSFSIDINTQEMVNITVYNSLGEIISLSQSNTKYYFDLSNYSRGIYFVRIDNELNQKILKVIKN